MECMNATLIQSIKWWTKFDIVELSEVREDMIQSQIMYSQYRHLYNLKVKVDNNMG